MLQFFFPYTFAAYSFHLPFCVRISEVNHEDEAGFTFMRDIFPGLIYRNLVPKVRVCFSALQRFGVHDENDFVAMSGRGAFC